MFTMHRDRRIQLAKKETGSEKNKSKSPESGTNIRRATVGARFNDNEQALWNALMANIQRRNPLVDTSKVLRDLLFGTLGIVTEEDWRILREGKYPVPVIEGVASQKDKHRKSGSG